MAYEALSFRDLRADEIECRVAMAKENGVSLLLYKNARCDMNILDETVGAGRWQRRHYECKGNLFCEIGIKVDTEWIWKGDCGTESNTEKEKGEASDSFKRAGFNWGIGRELYTAPFIWVKADDCIIKEIGGKFKCLDTFTVKHIKIENKRITELAIYDEKTKKDVFKFGLKPIPQTPTQGIMQADADSLIKLAEKAGVTVNKLLKKYKVKSILHLTPEQYEQCRTGLYEMVNGNGK